MCSGRDFLFLKDTCKVHSKFVEGVNGDESAVTKKKKKKKYSESFKAAEAKRNDRVVYLNSFVSWLIFLDSILNAA